MGSVAVLIKTESKEKTEEYVLLRVQYNVFPNNFRNIKTFTILIRNPRKFESSSFKMPVIEAVDWGNG